MESIFIPLVFGFGAAFLWICFALTGLFILIRLGLMVYTLRSGKTPKIAAFIWRAGKNH